MVEEESYAPRFLARMFCDSVECRTWTIQLISGDRSKIACAICGQIKELRGGEGAFIGKED